MSGVVRYLALFLGIWCRVTTFFEARAQAAESDNELCYRMLVLSGGLLVIRGLFVQSLEDQVLVAYDRGWIKHLRKKQKYPRIGPSPSRTWKIGALARFSLCLGGLFGRDRRGGVATVLLWNRCRQQSIILLPRDEYSKEIIPATILKRLIPVVPFSPYLLKGGMATLAWTMNSSYRI